MSDAFTPNLKTTTDHDKNNEDFSSMTYRITENKPVVNAIKIKFMTRDAVRLIDPDKITYGKKTTFLPALKWFDSRIKMILDAARGDDPFADQTLLDLERAGARFDEQIEEQSEGIRVQIRELFELNEAQLKLNNESHSYVVELVIKNPLSVKFLWSLKRFDNLLYLIYQAEKHCVISPKVARSYRNSAKRDYRALLSIAARWSHTSISREDIAKTTARTANAFEKNKQVTLSLEVLLMELRAECSPKISGRNNNQLPDDLKERILNLFNKSNASDDENNSQKQEQRAG
ncbi:AcaB family transcriptional regulator [Vibrio rumoiensis]|uniref:AcaB family transcriptional regulator n=1 Tax=Vibrio rumoiensis TaxID=76258 RepID=A0ABW7J0S3_9VIBR